jgi:hypothetical protein
VGEALKEQVSGRSRVVGVFRTVSGRARRGALLGEAGIQPWPAGAGLGT